MKDERDGNDGRGRGSHTPRSGGPQPEVGKQSLVEAIAGTSLTAANPPHPPQEAGVGQPGVGKQTLIERTFGGPGAANPPQTGLQLKPWPFPQQTPNNIGARSLGDKAAFIRKSVDDADEGWSRVVVDVFDQTDPAARIALQRQLDMATIVKKMPDFEATRLGTLGPLTAGQATLNKKRAAYLEQVINDFGDRAEMFVLFAFRGVYDDDAYTIFAELANRRYLHRLLAMPEVAKQIKARGLKTDGFNEPETGVLGAAGEVLGGLGAGGKHMVKDDRPGKYGWQKLQMPPEYAGALSQMEMDEFESGLTPKNAAISAIDQVTFGVPHGVVDLGRHTIGAVGDIAHGEYRAAGEKLSGAAVVLLTHLGVKAWRVISPVSPRVPAPGGGTNSVDNAPGVKGPEGPGQFVIPSFEGPITAQEAKLGAIFELNPEAQAAMGRLIARVGRAGVEKVAELVQANSRAALFVAEHGEAGVYALLEAEGDAALAETKLPKRQLPSGVESEGAEQKAEAFSNKFPDDPIGPPRQIIRVETLKTKTGRFNYIVTKERRLIIGRRDRNLGGGHIDLVNGDDVLAAGELEVIRGEIRYIDNTSGHYLPHGPSPQEVAETAFSDAGFNVKGKYIEKVYDKVKRKWVPKK